ncbi:MAG TPA: hypothetical protein VF814_06370 [Casimicrobiaceae bacterium]
MKRLGIALIVLFSAGFAQAQQTCQKIGNQVFCSGGNYAGSQTIGNQTYYNYYKPQQAQRQGLPSSSQQIGSIRYYDNGVTRQSIGNIDYFSNGVTKQRIGNIDYYSTGKVCRTIGNVRYCD